MTYNTQDPPETSSGERDRKDETEFDHSCRSSAPRPQRIFEPLLYEFN